MARLFLEWHEFSEQCPCADAGQARGLTRRRCRKMPAQAEISVSDTASRITSPSATKPKCNGAAERNSPERTRT